MTRRIEEREKNVKFGARQHLFGHPLIYRQTIYRDGRPVKSCAPVAASRVPIVKRLERRTHADYFVGGGGIGTSELNMSAMDFQVPSACFFQTVRYLPRSLVGLPAASFIPSS